MLDSDNFTTEGTTRMSFTPFGIAFRNICRKKGIGTSDLVAVSVYSFSGLSDYCRGEPAPDANFLDRMTEAFKELRSPLDEKQRAKLYELAGIPMPEAVAG